MRKLQRTCTCNLALESEDERVRVAREVVDKGYNEAD